MTMITNKSLKEMPSGNRACKDARKWFKRMFPQDYDSGVDMRVAWDTLKSDTSEGRSSDWLIWFGCHWLDATKRQSFAWFCAGLAMRYAGIEEFADNVTAENWREAKNAANAYANAYESNAGKAASYAAYAANAPFYATDTAYYTAEAAEAANKRHEAIAEMIERIESLLFIKQEIAL